MRDGAHNAQRQLCSQRIQRPHIRPRHVGDGGESDHSGGWSAHTHTVMHTDAHSYIEMHIVTYRCTQLHTGAQHNYIGV